MADAIPTLSISTEKICFVVLKAREFDVKDADTSSDEDGSNPADDRMVEVLENRPDDPVDQELVAFIEAMSEDEQVDLVTLTWLGRGDGGLEDWDDLRAEAARVHNRRTASYLLGIPLLPDFLEEALAAFGRSCEEFEEDHLSDPPGTHNHTTSPHVSILVRPRIRRAAGKRFRGRPRAWQAPRTPRRATQS